MRQDVPLEWCSLDHPAQDAQPRPNYVLTISVSSASALRSSSRLRQRGTHLSKWRYKRQPKTVDLYLMRLFYVLSMRESDRATALSMGGFLMGSLRPSPRLTFSSPCASTLASSSCSIRVLMHPWSSLQRDVSIPCQASSSIQTWTCREMNLRSIDCSACPATLKTSSANATIIGKKTLPCSRRPSKTNCLQLMARLLLNRSLTNWVRRFRILCGEKTGRENFGCFQIWR